MGFGVYGLGSGQGFGSLIQLPEMPRVRERGKWWARKCRRRGKLGAYRSRAAYDKGPLERI